MLDTRKTPRRRTTDEEMTALRLKLEKRGKMLDRVFYFVVTVSVIVLVWGATEL